jgi:hypothetical protein
VKVISMVRSSLRADASKAGAARIVRLSIRITRQCWVRCAARARAGALLAPCRSPPTHPALSQWMARPRRPYTSPHPPPFFLFTLFAALQPSHQPDSFAINK